MVAFFPRSQTLDVAECPKRLAMVRNEKESLRITFHRTSSKSPERVRHRADFEGKPSRPKPASRNSWFKSITSSFMSGGGNPRLESTSSSPFDSSIRFRRTRSLGDSKFFTPQPVNVEDLRLPVHMRRPELQLRRIQRRDLPSSKALPNRSSSVDRTQKYPLWWSA
ncbi:hypothetical protein BDM02DRAFT_3185808 [Thelephora ganbajun]|uniref:Uncharacterized protein n=1 Tax=Thelephora ganbajun TaxID=370292 RepID=A0ACB6ZK89_THEGA|nr:hypothetical protein BDM02DRAFT_3185808 [Thelephora ganbajun]